MKKRQKILMILALIMLVIGASQIASASAIGEDYKVLGVEVGWILIAGALGLMILMHPKVGILEKASKPVYAILVAVFFIGLALEFVEVETVAEAEIVKDECPTFEISGCAVTSGTKYITTASYDNDTGEFTIPITVNDSSDGNLTDHKTGLNITIDPISVTGMTADTMAAINFKSEYAIKYSGEKIFDESAGEYLVTWTKPGPSTIKYSGSYDLQASETAWLQIDYVFNNATAGNWVTELSKVGNTVTWYITLSNACNTWTKTITCIAFVVDYND